MSGKSHFQFSGPSEIAAGSVVIRDIPANTLAAGNPARVIRKITAADRAKYPWAEQDRPADLPK